MSHKKVIVNKKDKHRALLTDSLPYEVPIIFSNKNFYHYLKNQATLSRRFNNFLEKIITPDTYHKRHLIPYKYDITKGAHDTRELSLLHPCAQKKLVDFYEKYSDLITYYCSLSEISIRSPKQVTSSFYISNFNEDRNKLKTDSIICEDSELYSKYVTSFFSYSGYDKIYKFYSSIEMQQYEKKFSHMMIADITNCFGSVYTHSIAWAVKGKLFVKENMLQKNNFAQKFDEFLQKSNYEETNGIPIGPEVSRIFAEVILQRVDLNVIEKLNERKLKHNQNFVIKRYVDDYFIFGNSNEDIELILEVLKKELRSYRFHVNDKKIQKYERPFYTDKSKAISELQDVFDRLFDELYEEKEIEQEKIRLPKFIRKRKLVHAYIEKIKLVCHSNKIGYDSISNFCLGLMFKRVNDTYKNVNKLNSEVIEKEAGYAKNALALIDLAFFLYSTAPSVSSSYNLAKMLLVIRQFFQESFPDESEAIDQSIYDQIILFLGILHSKNEQNFLKKIKLESINLLLVLADLGEAKLLPEGFLQEIFSLDNDISLSYFETVCLLYYIGSYSDYELTRNTICEKIRDTFLNKDFNLGCSETLHLILDLMSCPNLDRNLRCELAVALLKKLQLASTQSDGFGLLNDIETNGWFISWRDVDLLNILERKVLQNPYE